MSEFIAPNVHPLLVHFPIALLVTGLLIELFSVLGWREHSFRVGGRWMILIGSLAGVVAVTSGIYALADVLRWGVADADKFGTWSQLAHSSRLHNDSPAWELMRRHVWLEAIGTAVTLAAVLGWVACSDRIRRRLAPTSTILLIIGVVCMGAGASMSGEAIYRHGVAVESPSATPTTESAAKSIEYYAPPLEMHVIGAGITVAIALLSISLAIRSAVIAEPPSIRGMAAALAGPPHDYLEAIAGTPAATPIELSQRIPSSRFALLTTLLGVMTAAGGWWLLASDSSASVLAFHNLWDLIRDPNQNSGSWLTRRLAHIIFGGAIVLLPLFIAVASRWMPRQKALLSVLILLLLAAISGQIWLGTLMTYDGTDGPVTKFAAAASQ